MLTQSKAELLDNLRVLVRDMLRLRTQGGAHAKLAHATGYVDGYMRVLLEAGIADHKSLLTLVADERRREHGPETARISPDGHAELESTSKPGVVAA